MIFGLDFIALVALVIWQILKVQRLNNLTNFNILNLPCKRTYMHEPGFKWFKLFEII